MAPPSGLRKAKCTKYGKRLALFCGSMAYVCVSHSCLLLLLIVSYTAAGSGKSVLWYMLPQLFVFICTYIIGSSTIIEDIRPLCRTGLATYALFYCDFRDFAKQDVRGLLSSLILQLCNQSDNFSAILSYFYSSYDRGSRQPSNDALMGCLKKMLGLPGQGVIYLIIDALDECPNVSGLPTPREQVLKVVQELIDLHFPHVHFCITSGLETDIRDVLEPLATHTVPLYEQVGQNQDIANFIRSFVHSDRRMRRWREEDKQFVIETLTKRAGGM
jgi:hypothetical protein